MSTPVTLYIPRDAAALSLGAESVAKAIAQAAAARGQALRIVRNGSRGLFWLEPLIEVLTSAGRIAYGPVQVTDVPELFNAGFLQGGAHRLRLGDITQLPYLARQQRLTFARVGVIDPVSIEDYLAHGGFKGLRRALELAPLAIVKEVTDSGIRGRGGAAFPTGIKWQTVHDQKAAQKYICCNADEGDSGTFSDRMLMEGDPLTLIEGMLIAGLAVGATQGYIYLRAEYPHAYRTLNQAIDARARPGIWAPMCSAAGAPLNSRCASVPAPTSVAKRPRCSRALRDDAARCACAHRCRRSKACSRSPPS